MSMNVDFATPLTDQERSYLAERGRYADLERAGNTVGIGDGDGTGPRLESAITSDRAASERERLLARLREIDPELGARLDETDETGTVVDDTDDNELPYSDWTVPELDAELKERKLPTSGTKPEKVSRLEQDDLTAQG